MIINDKIYCKFCVIPQRSIDPSGHVTCTPKWINGLQQPYLINLLHGQRGGADGPAGVYNNQYL